MKILQEYSNQCFYHRLFPANSKLCELCQNKYLKFTVVLNIPK